MRLQNSAVDISTPALKLWAPKFTTSGTIVIPSAVARAGSMSDAESVTMATRLTVGPPLRPDGVPRSYAPPPRERPRDREMARYPVHVNRSLRAVLVGTFTLRFSTGLTGAALTFYLANLQHHTGLVDQLLGLGPGQTVSPLAFGVVAALFYVSELVLSPIFGVVSDRLGHYRVMQFGPGFGFVATIVTWATTNLPIIGTT